MKKIIEDLNWRFACKAFDINKRLSDQEIEDIKEIIKLTPTSYGLQPFRVIVIDNKELRNNLKIASFNQGQVTDASHFLVFIANKDIKSRIDKYKNMLINNGSGQEPAERMSAMMTSVLGNLDDNSIYSWASKQSYIALGSIMTALAIMRIDSCPMEGFDRNEYNKILGLDTNKEEVSVAIAIGYRSAEPEYNKLRFDDLFESR